MRCRNYTAEPCLRSTVPGAAAAPLMSLHHRTDKDVAVAGYNRRHRSRTLYHAALLLLSLLLTLLPHFAGGKLRTMEVSPRVPVNHDTFLYMCSQDVNEQNVAVRAWQAWLATYPDKASTIAGILGPVNDGRNQINVILSSKGCAYRSDFNAGYTQGPRTHYLEGIEMTYYVQTSLGEILNLRVFRSLPEWYEVWDDTVNATRFLGRSQYWLSQAVWVNSPSQDIKVTWVGESLLDEPCQDLPGCSYEDLGWMVQSDLDCTGCKLSEVYPTWNDTDATALPAFFPG